MKALTIWQPWASLIIAGAKPYEFRGWIPPQSIVGQTIAIHAGARPVRKSEISDLRMRLTSADAWTTALIKEVALPLLERWHTAPGQLPLSSVLGTAVLGQARGGFDIVEEFGGVINDSDRDQHANFAWPMTKILKFEPFHPAKGAQGFWDWRTD